MRKSVESLDRQVSLQLGRLEMALNVEGYPFKSGYLASLIDQLGVNLKLNETQLKRLADVLKHHAEAVTLSSRTFNASKP